MTDDERDRILHQLAERQKLTAKAVADLALGLNSAERQARDRHQELVGIALGSIAERRTERERKSSEDQTDSFKLSTGDKFELTRRTQKRIVRWVLLGLAAVGLHAAQYLWERAAEHRKPAGESER